MGEEAGFMMDEGNEGAETGAPHKVYRHRKKQLYQSIRKQMEFYFSDSNLTKDRFLGNLLKEDPCIDLSIFIRFNRIRALTTDISDIAKALRHSELLSVTEDGTKVFRTKPVQRKENIDDCTIYVEQLPPDADHDWLRDVFSAYGNVAYVSIPKYRTSGKIKGFGFVEFDTPEEANKTLEAFGARGCRLSAEIAPDKLCSISTFEGDETSNVDEKNQGELSGKEDKKEQTAEKDSLQHKRKRSSHRESIKDPDNEQASENEAKSTQSKGEDFSEDVKGSTKEEDDSREENHDRRKKSAKNQEEKVKFVEKDENEKADESSSSTKRKRKKLSEEEVEDEEIDLDASKKRRKLIEEQYTGEVKVEEGPKKKRKKKQEDDTLEEEECENSVASKRTKTETTENEDVAPENIQLDQQVKKKRRRETEEETRENITEEDEQVSESRSHYVTEECEIENVEGESKRKRKRKKKKKNKQDKQDVSLQILSKREWKRLRNKYLDLQRAKMKCLKQYLSKQYWSNQMQQQGNTDTPEPEVKVSQPRITYTPGVIVCAVLDEPVTDIRKFKADTKSLQDVEYVDVLPGANTAYIRCSTADGAKQLASSNPWVSGVVLKGEEETEYWDKIMADRKVKFSNKIRTKQRGRDKVLRRAERELGKHIKFDE